jgi:excisionase family DNA binding protein
VSTYLTVSAFREAISSLGVSRSTVQRACADGRIRSTRVGRTYRIPESEVARVLADGLGARGPVVDEPIRIVRDPRAIL